VTDEDRTPAIDGPALDTLAVVTVAYNSSGHMEHFLGSLRSTEDRPWRVVIADNASADVDELDRIAARHDAEVLHLPENLGYGGAINEAVRTLPPSIDWVLVVNPDVVFKDGAIGKLLAAGLSDDAVGGVGPGVVDADGVVYPSARNLPSLRTGVGHAVFVRIWPANPWTRAYLSDRGSTDARPAGWLSGSCILVRRTAFDAIGGFDDGYFMYFEDVDLGYRLGRAGWTNLYWPGAVVEHSGAHSTSRDSARMILVHHASAARYLDKKYSGWYLAPLRLALRSGLRMRGSWLARQERRRAERA